MKHLLFPVLALSFPGLSAWAAEPIAPFGPGGPTDAQSLLAAGAELSARLDAAAGETDIGFRVTNSCFEKWGPGEFNEILHGAVREGTRCLLDLQEKGKGDAPEGVTNALRNALVLESLRQRSPVFLTCEQEDFDWGEGAAQVQGKASVSPLDPEHPLVSLNPDFPKTDTADSGRRELEAEEVKALLFHEHLHNLGYAHGEDIEYSFACEACCFSNPEEWIYPKSKLLACRICTGGYRDRHDPRFLRDLVEFAYFFDEVGPQVVGHFTRQASLKRRDPEALAMLARSQAQSGSPAGLHLARKVEGRLQAELSAYAQTTLASVKEGSHPDLPDEISASAESVAEAHWLLYGEHDSVGTLDLLLARKSDLRHHVLNGSSGDDESDVGRAIVQLTSDVKRLLDELRLNRFQERIYPPDGRLTSQVADELHLSLFPDEA